MDVLRALAICGGAARRPALARLDNLSVVRGYSVLRYYYDDVVHHPALMLAEVRAVLAGVNLQV